MTVSGLTVQDNRNLYVENRQREMEKSALVSKIQSGENCPLKLQYVKWTFLGRGC